MRRASVICIRKKIKQCLCVFVQRYYYIVLSDIFEWNSKYFTPGNNCDRMKIGLLYLFARAGGKTMVVHVWSIKGGETNG